MFESPHQSPDFDTETIIVNLQILPINPNQQRTVIVAVGMRDDVPLVQSYPLSELELPPAITATLNQLQQEFPTRKQKQAERREQKRLESLQQDYRHRTVTPPAEGQTATPPQPNSQQLTLF